MSCVNGYIIWTATQITIQIEIQIAIQINFTPCKQGIIVDLTMI